MVLTEYGERLLFEHDIDDVENTVIVEFNGRDVKLPDFCVNGVRNPTRDELIEHDHAICDTCDRLVDISMIDFTNELVSKLICDSCDTVIWSKTDHNP